MTRVDNADGTWNVIFDSEVEAMDDCDDGIYSESEEYSEVRTETEYMIRFGHSRGWGEWITCTKKPYIKGNSIVYSFKDEKGQPITLVKALGKYDNGIAVMGYKITRMVFRKVVNVANCEYQYKYGEAKRGYLDF